MILCVIHVSCTSFDYKGQKTTVESLCSDTHQIAKYIIISKYLLHEPNLYTIMKQELKEISFYESIFIVQQSL